MHDPHWTFANKNENLGIWIENNVRWAYNRSAILK